MASCAGSRSSCLLLSLGLGIKLLQWHIFDWVAILASHDGRNGPLRAIIDHDALTYHLAINPDTFVLNLLARQKLGSRSVGHLDFPILFNATFVNPLLFIINEIVTN